jgi:hypothetical protein
VIGLSALRLLVAKVLETALLLDRALFLCEALPEGSHVGLYALFDPALSPRNTAIVAIKQQGGIAAEDTL